MIHTMRNKMAVCVFVCLCICLCLCMYCVCMYTHKTVSHDPDILYMSMLRCISYVCICIHIHNSEPHEESEADVMRRQAKMLKKISIEQQKSSLGRFKCSGSRVLE